MARRLRFAALPTLLLLALALGLTLGKGDPVVADDANNTTALGVGSRSFDADESAVSSVIASLSTTDAQAYTWWIWLHATPSGGLEALVSGTTASRANGETSGVELSHEASDFASGTGLRAVFTTKDSSGNVRFSYQRTYTMP